MSSPGGPAPPRSFSYADACRGYKAIPLKPQATEKSLPSRAQSQQADSQAPSTPTKAITPVASPQISTSTPTTPRPADSSNLSPRHPPSEQKNPETGISGSDKGTPTQRFSYAAAVRGRQSESMAKLNKKNPKQEDTNAATKAAAQPPKLPTPAEPALSRYNKQAVAARATGSISLKEDEGSLLTSAADMDRLLMPPPPLPVRSADRRVSMSEHPNKQQASNGTAAQRIRSISPLRSRETAASRGVHIVSGKDNHASVGDEKKQPKDAVQDNIDAVIDAERQRVEDLEIWKRHLNNLMRRHDAGEIDLWHQPINWDVQIECGECKWQLHWCMLTRDHSHLKTRYLPPSYPLWKPTIVSLPKHQPIQISTVLNYMYTKTYPDAQITSDNPMNGEVIRRNTFMYICGSSVDYTLLMATASNNINESASILRDFVTADLKNPKPQPHIHALLVPLSLALQAVIDQGPRFGMMALRVAIARFMNTILPWLWTQSGFLVHYSETENWNRLMVSVHEDIAMSARYGFLVPYMMGPNILARWIAAREGQSDPLIDRIDEFTANHGPMADVWAAYAAQQSAAAGDGASATQTGGGGEKTKTEAQEQVGSHLNVSVAQSEPVARKADINPAAQEQDSAQPNNTLSPSESVPTKVSVVTAVQEHGNIPHSKDTASDTKTAHTEENAIMSAQNQEHERIDPDLRGGGSTTSPVSSTPSDHEGTVSDGETFVDEEAPATLDKGKGIAVDIDSTDTAPKTEHMRPDSVDDGKSETTCSFRTAKESADFSLGEKE